MPDTPELAARLDRGLRQLELNLPAEAAPRLLAYVELLQHWNRAYNLTAVRDPLQMIPRHLLDSLAILPFLQLAPGARLIDVGSGAGLPGIPLAIACPQLSITLLDSNGKKTRFLRQALAELGLDNVSVVQERVERYHPGQPYDAVTCRAFAALPDILNGCAHLLRPGGRVLAMKGMLPGQELSQLPKGFNVLACEVLRVPDLEGERHLLVLAAQH